MFPSVTNIGLRPTFGDVTEPVIETHMLDFERDLYGSAVRALVRPADA